MQIYIPDDTLHDLLVLLFLLPVLFVMRRKDKTQLKHRFPRAKRAPVTHDYTYCTWGRWCTWSAMEDRGTVGDLSGCGHGLSPGDYMLLSDGARYRLDSIAYAAGTDMWFATASLAPRDKVEWQRDERLRMSRIGAVG